MTLITSIGAYEIHLPTTGGKAGKGCNVTSTIQVRRHHCVVKQIRFIVASAPSFDNALNKALRWIRDQQAAEVGGVA